MTAAVVQAPPTAWIPRARLVRTLLSAPDTPLVLIVAPAGYGKTSLLSEWSIEDRRPFAWVTLRDTDTGPAELLRALAAALLVPGQKATLAQVCSGLRRRESGVVLVIDDAHVLTARDSLDVVSALIEHSGPGSQIVLASRTEPSLGLGGLRAQRKLLELGPADLAMTAPEAAQLARSHGFDLSHTQLGSLVHRTEGWPAGLYLS